MQMMLNGRRHMAPVLAMVALLAGCSSDDSGPTFRPASLSHGVIFTYPIDGQTDVPTATRFYVTFSRDASQSAVDAACSVDGGGNVSGNFCLVGPAGAVAISPVVAGPVVQFETGLLSQGSQYALYVRSPVIGGDSSNLPATGPLLSFTTSQTDPVSNQVPLVTAINGENPAVYAMAGTPAAARYPFMDFSTIRVEFSEPLDEKTVQVGAGFEFVMVDDGGETPVLGALMARRQHLSFDPEEDLLPGTTYRLRLGSAIRDLNGEALAAVTYEMVPQDANLCNCVITQHFNTSVAFGEAGFPATSRLTGRPVNAIDLYSSLIGANDINLRDSTLQAELADPSRFGGLVPFVIRRGNVLNITGLDLSLGGAVPANLRTGDIRATFLSDATGFMGRNPYRSASTLPDEDKSPVFVYLIFDLALTGSDEAGNAVLNQTIPHVQATGTARVVNGTLAIETVRTLEMDLLGLDRAPAHMVLGIHSDLAATAPDDTAAPRITGAYPADGATDFAVADGLSLIFSEPMDNAGLVANDQIQLLDLSNSGLPVPFQLTHDGSTILLKPDAPLAFGHQYRVTLGALTDISANRNGLVLDGDDATGGDGSIEFRTEDPVATAPAGPLVSSIYTGAGCTLTGSSQASPGHCTGGLGGDTNYQPFELPANGFLDVQFNQPMNQATLVAGTSCNSGPVRVEQVDGAGNCVAVVPGSLTADTRSFRFKPTEPWVVGTHYRLTLVPGANASCAPASEICGSNNLPLNSDPLNGAGSADAGGANLVIRLQAVAASTDIYLPLKMQPVADINGNGFLDPGESPQLANSAGVAITDVDGIISSAVLDGDPNIYLTGSLPVTVGLPEPLSIDGATWGMTIAGDSQIPIRINPGILYGTSIRMDAVANVVFSIPINDVDTGQSILRLRETGDTPIRGYIVQEEGVDEPQFIAELDLYMDAPDMVIQVLGLISVSHDLNSKPLRAVIKGPVSFLADGRILIEPVNVEPVNLTVGVSALGLGGSIDLSIGTGSMRMSLVGNPLKGRR